MRKTGKKSGIVRWGRTTATWPTRCPGVDLPREKGHVTCDYFDGHWEKKERKKSIKIEREAVLLLVEGVADAATRRRVRDVKGNGKMPVYKQIACDWRVCASIRKRG